MTPPRLAEEMAASIPGARLEILPDGSHTLPIDAPDRVNALVEGFVAEIERIGRPPRRRSPRKRTPAG